MPQTMTLDEKLDISNRTIALKKSGDRDGYDCLMRTIPMPPYLAKVTKEKMGVDFFLNGGWNLSEAESEFGIGKDLLNK